MTKEIELLKQEIKMLQSKLEFLEEIETHNAKPKMHLESGGEFSIVSYDGRIYYRLEFPTAILWFIKQGNILSDAILKFVDDLETHRLLEDLWNNEVITQKDVEVQECPDDPECYDEVEWDEKDNSKPMDDVVNRLVKQYQYQKLYNRVRDQLGYSIDCCDEIVDLVEDWLPKEQSAAGSQNVDVELLVEGFNDAIRKMKEMLR